MESHILPCPVCGVGINATLSVCPVCKSETHFVDNAAAGNEHRCAACGEIVPEKAAFCPMCGEPTGKKTPMAASQPAATPIPVVPTPQPQATPNVQPPQPQVATNVPPQQPQYGQMRQPAQQQAEKKSKLTPIVVGLLAALALAAIIILAVTLLNKNSRNETGPESVSTNIAMEHTLDSIKATLPVAAEEVVRYTNDMPSLFYLYDNRLHRVDAKTLEDETIDFQESNSKARIGYRNGGIIEAKPTKDDRYLFIHANGPGDDQEEILLRYDVKTGKVNILGTGRSITDNGSGYIIKGINSEKRVDAYGNIVGDRDPGLTEDDQEEETKPVEKPRNTQPVKPKVEETPQTEVITVQPEPQKPADPPVQNQGTGFHLEEI